MNKIKRFMLLAVALCMFSVTAYAETQYLTYNATIENGNESVVEDGLTSDTDYSDLLVNVIKCKGDQKTVIYSGALSGYESGMLSGIDFSEIQFVLFFEWDGPEDEAIYIIPAREQAVLNMSTENSVANQPSENTVELQSSNSSTAVNIQTNMSLVYNDKYYENILLPGQTLSIPVTVTNTGSMPIEIVSYIAEYDLSGCLVNVAQGEAIPVPANDIVQTTLLKDFSAAMTGTAKVFLWEKNSMHPVSDSVYLTIYNQDYYADTYTNAQKINLDKQLCGVINTSTDIDIVKFTPSFSGIYALQLAADSGTICGLYNSSQALLNSVAAYGDKNYLLYSLNANQDYYIRFNGAENNSYEITPALPSELVTLTKNIGTANNLAESNDYNVYKFTPTTTGSYVITVVDSDNVQADLYSSSFEKIASSSVGDSTVSFRITSEMTANQEYYIVVYPKSEAQLGSYTLYIEEPFDVISVQ